MLSRPAEKKEESYGKSPVVLLRRVSTLLLLAGGSQISGMRFGHEPLPNTEALVRWLAHLHVLVWQGY